MRRLVKFYLFFTLIMMATLTWTQGSVQAANLFDQANERYRAEEFDKAISLYESHSEDHPSPEVFYNLGNAYFKNKSIGMCVLNYDRSLDLNPRDKDTRSNLNYVKMFVEYEIEDHRNWHLRSLDRALSHITFKECLLGVLIFYFVFIARILGGLVLKQGFYFGALSMTFLVLTLLGVGITTAKHTNLGMGKRAVVTSRHAEVRYGPSKSDRIAFRLSEGLEVYVQRDASKWFRIELLDGQSGWVAQSSVSVV
jgi:tetratricopeptide (TPR) repeat protein